MTLAKEKSNGEIEIKHVGGPEMISVRDMLDALKSGQVDLAQTAAAYYAGIVPETCFLGIPFGWSSEEQLEAFNDIHERLNKFYIERLGCRILSISTLTAHLVWSTKNPITTAENFKGLKLRIPGGMHGAGIKKFGASPVKVPVAEVITALERGIIDGAQWAEVAVNYFHGDQVLKYATDFVFADTKCYFYISERAWNKLSDKLKKIMLAIGNDLNEYAFMWGTKVQSEARDALKKRGAQYVKLDQVEEAKWKKQVLDATVEKALSMSPDHGQQILDAIKPYSHYK